MLNKFPPFILFEYILFFFFLMAWFKPSKIYQLDGYCLQALRPPAPALFRRFLILFWLILIIFVTGFVMLGNLGFTIWPLPQVSIIAPILVLTKIFYEKHEKLYLNSYETFQRWNKKDQLHEEYWCWQVRIQHSATFNISATVSPACWNVWIL